MVEPLRHRQTKGAATDMFYLMPPRHISTLPFPEVEYRLPSSAFVSTADMAAFASDVRKVPTCDIRYACFRFGADPILERRNSGIAVSSG
jgi:hypothetical protein